MIKTFTAPKFGIIIAFLLMFLSQNINAQEIEIVNKVTLEPVEDVLVYNPANNFYESTNDEGKVTLTGLELLDTIFFQHPSFVIEAMQLERLMNNGYKVYLSQKIVLIEEVVITSSKTKEVISEVANQIEIISKSEIIFRNPQTSADLLTQSGEVFVQKSQMGGGSPVLRGFEANKVLLVVDGVRLNNAIFRNGHLQNVITIDPSVLQRTEVVFGPGSVMYGSDAIGGVMHFVTQDPQLAHADEKVNFKFNGFTRYSSANHEKSIGGTMNFGFEKWGSLSSFSYSDFGDLRMGGNRAFSPGTWGLEPYYIDRIDGVDSIVKNEDPLIQRNSGYSQWNLLQKFMVKPNEDVTFGVNFQASSSSDVPRFEQFNDIQYNIEVPYLGEYEGINFAEWYYGPQRRIFGSLNAKISNKKMFDESSIILAAQSLEETRVKRKYQKVEKIYNVENVNVASLNADFTKAVGVSNKIKYGIEVNYNHVQSTARIVNFETNELINQTEPTRYPDGGSNTQTYSFYFMDKWKPKENITINAGVRYSHFVMNSQFNDTTFIKLPTTDFHFSRGAISGSIGAVFIPLDGFEIKVNASTGFRSPNVDDYGKVREQAGEVTIPNLDLTPEYAYNAEIGIVKSFNKLARISLTGYYTHLTDAIVRSHTQVNGSDSILYNGENVYIITNENAENARVYGFAIGFDTDIGKFVSMTANFNYTKGKILPSGEPAAHIPPLFGKVSMLTKLKRFQAEVYVHFNAQKSAKDYSSSSEDRLDEATEGDGGTPSWFTFNFRTTAQLHKNLSLQIGIENLFDQHYKPFSSGISAPGRNYVVTLRGKF